MKSAINVHQLHKDKRLSRWSERTNSSCSTSCIRRAFLVTKPL